MVIQSSSPQCVQLSSHVRTHSYGALPDGEVTVEEGATDDECDSYEETKSYKKHSMIEIAPGPVNDEVAVIANTINSILGVSLFAMPWGFQQSGMLGGAVVLSLVAWLSFETARMLLVAQNTCYLRFGDVLSYPEIAGTTLGPVWSKVVQSATILSCLGGCTGYLIFFGETVGQALGIESDDIIYIATVPLILLSWIRSFRELTVFAVFGVGSLFLTVAVVLMDGSRHMRSVEDVPLFQRKSFANFMGPATFLFTIHYIILAMGAEALRLRPWSTFHTTVADGRANSALVWSIGVSYLVSLLLVVVVGGAGFLMYRNSLVVKDHEGDVLLGCEDRVCQNIILNISPGMSRNVVGLAMSVVIVLSYILILVPAREHIEREVLTRLKLDTERKEEVCRNVLRTALVLATVFVAIQAPYFGSVMGAVGGLTDALQCFVFPPLIYVALEKDLLSARSKLFANGIVVFGIAVVAYTFFRTSVEVFEEVF